MDSYTLIDNKNFNQYELHVAGLKPRLEYIVADNEIYFTHTEIPFPLEGRGFGAMLVEKALADIEQKGLRLVPLCPFVAEYIQKHPDWKRVVIKGVKV